VAIGLLGGTFDPIHMGHLRIAEEVCDHFSLERIYFIPTGIQPFKQMAIGAQGLDRMNMVKMAIRGNEHFHASSFEMSKSGVSYTIDTVKVFSRRYCDLYFILGADAFRDVGLWKSYEELFHYTNFVVMGRPGYQRDILPEAVTAGIHAIDDFTWEHTSGKRIHFPDITQLDISSTQIRELVKQGKSVKYLVPGAVDRYITQRGLYTN
jgi:nicotinate-nucleotide adenylyltransferase